MTLTTLVTLNAVLAATVVFGILWLLISGIRSDARSHAAARSAVQQLRGRRARDRIAA